MPSLAIAFTGNKDSKKLKNYLVSSGSQFFAKIDDRGRIYLPSKIRQLLNGSASFLNSSTKNEFEKKSSLFRSKRTKNKKNPQPDNSNGFSFCAAVLERRIFIAGNGKYFIDSKNRVSVPADIRRSFGMNAGDVIKLEFGGEKNESTG